jgi:hypothetical protein
MVSFRFVSFRFVSFRFVSFRFVSFRFVSFRFVSFRFVSFRFVSFRFDSIRFQPYKFKRIIHFFPQNFYSRTIKVSYPFQKYFWKSRLIYVDYFLKCFSQLLINCPLLGFVFSFLQSQLHIDISTWLRP